jgi:prepilin-type N-terminal cleavage/methylation domain-containing protein
MSAPAGRAEGGFTLPELLITVVITSIMVLSLSSAFIVGAKTTTQANSRFQESHDAQLLTTYFPADAASATTVSTTSIAGSTCPVPGTPVVLFTWTESGVRRDAFYGRPAGTSEVARQYCENNVAKSRVTVIRMLAGDAAAMTVGCPTAAACTGSPSVVKLTVKERSGLYAYSIQGSPRATTAKAP